MSEVRKCQRYQNPDKYREQSRRRYQKNLALYRAYQRKWNRNHPEYVVTRKLERKRAIRRAHGSHTADEFRALVHFYGSRCLCCGRPNGAPQSDQEIVRDHIVPISKGGSNGIDNIQPLCRACNSSKSDRAIDYRPRRAEAA
ncbi:MAG: HNH endonuclease [Bryobacterales bacterium]|nr:HNH endonuclease [Bryobacterales bacterium]